MSDDELFFKTATELGKLLRAKEISSLELTGLFLDRLERLEPRYNALAQLTPNLALEQVRRTDVLLARTEASSPLTGVAFGAKDLLATRGIPTRWGLPLSLSFTGNLFGEHTILQPGMLFQRETD